MFDLVSHADGMVSLTAVCDKCYCRINAEVEPTTEVVDHADDWDSPYLACSPACAEALIADANGQEDSGEDGWARLPVLEFWAMIGLQIGAFPPGMIPLVERAFNVTYPESVAAD